MTTDHAARADELLAEAALHAREADHHRGSLSHSDADHSLQRADLAIRAASVHAALDSSDAYRAQAAVQRDAADAALRMAESQERFLAGGLPGDPVADAPREPAHDPAVVANLVYEQSPTGGVIVRDALRDDR